MSTPYIEFCMQFLLNNMRYFYTFCRHNLFKLSLNFATKFTNPTAKAPDPIAGSQIFMSFKTSSNNVAFF